MLCLLLGCFAGVIVAPPALLGGVVVDEVHEGVADA